MSTSKFKEPKDQRSIQKERAKRIQSNKSHLTVNKFNEFMSNNTFVSLHKGEVFGESGLIYSIPRAETAVAAEDSDLFVISKECFITTLSVSLLI